MEKFAVNKNKCKKMTKENLLELTKEELVDRVLQLQSHNQQLRNVIAKRTGDVFCREPNEKKKCKRAFDFKQCHTRPVLLRFLYFGWNYHGLAVQEDTSETIEHHLFSALTKTCLIESRDVSEYHRCGRTDKGVSSFGQVISIRLRSKFDASQQNSSEGLENEFPYCKMLNRLLPKDIRAVAWLPVPEERVGYSARFDCRQRTYKYYFPRGDLDLESMRSSCGYLIGSHDFRNLCKMDVANGVTEFVRDIASAQILPLSLGDDDDGYSVYYLQIVGNAFLWHQIRCIMGVLLLVGEGKEEPHVMQELLNVEQNPKKPQYSMALELPLNLFHCEYDLLKSVSWHYETDELRNIILTLQEKWTMDTIKSFMIKDVLDSLMSTYTAKIHHLSEKDGQVSADSGLIRNQSRCLLQGVRSNVYKPLLKRNTCESLEDRIEHYVKKQRLKIVAKPTMENS